MVSYLPLNIISAHLLIMTCYEFNTFTYTKGVGYGLIILDAIVNSMIHSV